MVSASALFYLNYNGDGDPELFNSDIHISNVIDSDRVSRRPATRGARTA